MLRPVWSRGEHANRKNITGHATKQVQLRINFQDIVRVVLRRLTTTTPLLALLFERLADEPC